MRSAIQIYKTSLFLAALAICSGQVFAQSGIDSIAIKFNNYRNLSLQEKLYLHTDQEVYFAGEILWLKAYYVDGSFHKPLDVSKVAYVEVIDKENNAVLQGKIQLSKGFGTGSFFIKASIPSGHYVIRAYTNWMRNLGPEFFFQKPISIVNPFQKLTDQKAVEAPAFDAQFFPEGGQLVNGLTNQVAVQVVNSSGRGIDYKGAIINDRNDTIVSFKPVKFGIGSFNFTPALDTRYRAVIIDAKKRRQLFAMPVALNTGYVLHAEESDRDLIITVLNNNPNSEGGYLFIHSRERISFSSRIALQQTSAISISKKNLHDGISHITLFNSDGQPVCERLFFKRPEKNLSIEISGSRPDYKVREKVVLNLSTKDGERNPESANLSISVAAKDSLMEASNGDIQNYLWLTSDLRGNIESPDYYLSPTADPKSIDRLMLTHGWRRFEWKKILEGKKAAELFVPEFRGHLIRGKVRNDAGLGMKNIETYVSSVSKNILLYVAKSDAEGNVLFQTKNFTGSKKIIAQTNVRKDTLYNISLESPFSNLFAPIKRPLFSIPPLMENYIVTRSIGMQVQDIYYKEKNETFITPSTDTVSFFGKPDEVYLLDDYTRFPVMEEVMREYVSGVFVRKRRDGFHFLMLNRISGDLLREDPMILLDGIPVFDVDKIMEFSPLQVKKIDLLTRKYFLGPMTFPGIVSYTTYNADLGDFHLGPRVVILDYEGLQLQREFYSPSYDTPLKRQGRLPDRRNLLLWDPKIITGRDGTKQIEFYTSDNPGTYKVTIEGINNSGLAGKSSIEFSVKP